MRLFSIRTRFLFLLALLLLFPFLVYRLALDFNRQLLEQQMIQQSQTVQNLALILSSRPDLWSLQIFRNDTERFQHLDLNRSTVWIVNRQGVTTYVVGHLDLGQTSWNAAEAPFEWIGKHTIRLIHSLFPHSLPYLIPFEPQPEAALIRQALTGATAQRFRFDEQKNPITLMSATPLYLNGTRQGAIVLEQRADNLFGPRLKHFHRIVGISTVIILLLVIAFGYYAVTLSNRIMRLQRDVARAFDPGHHRLRDFDDTKLPDWKWDEVDRLRHQVYQLLDEIGHYEAFLRQLPRALRHEIHNPLNRLNLSLQRLEQTGQLQPYLKHAQHGVEQLQNILNALSEAGSIEQSVQRDRPHRYPLHEMLPAYLEAQRAQYGKALRTVLHWQPDEEVWICGDDFLLEQALDKLIDNAVDFSKDGQVIVEAFRKDGMAIIEVINRGQLPDTLQPDQLFSGMTSERPVSSNGAEQRPHLGLGLYIARLITEFHNGHIRAFQQDDKVHFRMELPLC